jgi:phosphate transport system substrate-binding protein
MTLWAEEYKRLYPNVNIQVEGKGSSTAPPALTEGASNLGPMSRKMKDKEIEAFEKKHGHKPTGIPVAIDALAVFVHKDNPVKGLSIDQVDAIFSSTRKCGATGSIDKWGQVAGMPADWKDHDVQLFGRNSVSGTYGYFKSNALCKGDYKNGVNEQPGSASVVQSVATSLNAIGYSGIGYVTSGVRAVPLAAKGSTDMIAATPENALSGKYPLSRYLWVYLNKNPNKALNPLEGEFMKLILSKEGQLVTVKDGYIPLPKDTVEKELVKLK